MSEPKTPLELSNHIKDRSAKLFEVRRIAKALGMTVLAMTGERDSKLSALADATLRAPSCETFMIQEYHLPVYHAICAMLEEEFFGK